MFLRFRETPNDGIRPPAASHTAACIVCRHPYRLDDEWKTCTGHCHAKPRCRWRIGRDEQLQPYRLKVLLADNKRIDGKVRQETVAFLGSIDATWLERFWRDAPENLRAENWKPRSLQARAVFWELANERLDRLADRLGPDLKRFRTAIRKQVPRPTKAERKLLEVLEAEAERQ